MLQVTGKLAALKGLDARLKEIRSYLDLVIDGKLPLNHEILYHLQVLFIHIYVILPECCMLYSWQCCPFGSWCMFGILQNTVENLGEECSHMSFK